MDIKQSLNNSEKYIIDMRRHFHAHPEPSFKEFETTKKIAEELEKIGIEYEIPQEEPKTWVIGHITKKWYRCICSICN
ncbi:hypothetical protein FL857_04830 [Criibacterium bergeronii]|uniref:Amidohydrolase n=1 Tax=Criibacterium bergeronii TaxID=1871336 RepID=A0A552V992_9FIRM|nr:hypothetical protein [Criibacterium bergeronii]TRW27036.1 hypothetical protein FL857_04830 [Criibacterium bergeronii]